MPVIQNQQTGLVHLLTVDGTQITEHSRTVNITQAPSSSEIMFLSGKTKRYFKDTKISIQLSFRFLPNSNERTVDGRGGRDFIKSLCTSPGDLEVKIVRQPGGPEEVFSMFVNSYQETLVRREIQYQASYYDVNIDLVEA